MDIYFLMAREFGFTPEQVDNLDVDIAMYLVNRTVEIYRQVGDMDKMQRKLMRGKL